jgi:dTDP-glucose 4,6-dehydratase
MSEIKKILCTGSTGFIISNFVRRVFLEKAPYSVVSLDRVSDDPSAVYINKGHNFYIADIRDQHIIDIIFDNEKPDIVIHGAAQSAVDKSLIEPNEFITNNVLGTQIIINACLKYKVKKLIYLSSDEIYGHLTNENDLPWTEENPLNPRNPYSASKASGELLVKAAHHSHGLIYNITRSCNNYGPRQTTDKLIPRIIKCILNDQKIPVYGQGLQMRDWLHVFDNCAALLTILKSGEPNQIYNISANQEYTNIEVVQAICNAMGKGHNLIDFVKDRPGHDFRYAVNCDKLKALGWKSSIKFKPGINDTIEWYKINSYALK